jgi:purine-binding chemotaxis protein CheW
MSNLIPASSSTLPVASADSRAPRDTPPQTRQFLTFKLGGESYAAPILTVKEIIEYGQVTTVPMMPGFIRGVINLRGNVVSVVDLAARFGQHRGKVGKRSCVVIIEANQDGEKQIMGILVDSVDEVVEIAGSDIDPPPTFGAKIRTDFIEGLGKHKGQFVIILNLDRVLSVEEMSLLSGEEGIESPAAHYEQHDAGAGREPRALQ